MLALKTWTALQHVGPEHLGLLLLLLQVVVMGLFAFSNGFVGTLVKAAAAYSCRPHGESLLQLQADKEWLCAGNVAGPAGHRLRGAADGAGGPTTPTALQQDGPDHLGTCGTARSPWSPNGRDHLEGLCARALPQAGTLMTCFLNAGLLLGAVLSFLWPTLLGL